MGSYSRLLDGAGGTVTSTSTTLSGNWTGPYTQAGTVTVIRTGDLITLLLNEVAATSGSAVAAFTFSEALGTTVRPSDNDTLFGIPVTDAVASELQGFLTVSTAGVLTVNNEDFTNFSGSGTITLEKTGVSWILE